MEEKVKQAIDEIRPFLQRDGGDIEFIGLEGTVVRVRLRGACACCPGAMVTLKMGVENHLKEKVPEVSRVEAV